MPSTDIQARFLQALDRVTRMPLGPINLAAVERDKSTGLEKAFNLLGYGNYLASARAWKASKKAVPPSFEREVYAQATAALSDARELAAATLRITRSLNQAGLLDHALTSWMASIKTSGPVQIKDLWNNVANNASTKQLLQQNGLTDDLFHAITETIGKLEGRVSAQRGKLMVEGKLAGQDRTRITVIRTSFNQPPTNVAELLNQGQFELLMQRFSETGARSIPLIKGKPRDLLPSEIVFAGAIQTVQGMAEHKRRLQDTGLATYAGNEHWVALALLGIVLTLVGGALSSKYCQGRDANTAACIVGVLLLILGIAVLAVVAGAIVSTGVLGTLFVFVLVGSIVTSL